MKQSLIISLLIITLIVNVTLGIELYTVLHKSSQPNGSVPLNVSQIQVLTNSTLTKTITTTITQTSSESTTHSSSQSNTSSKVYNFYIKVHFKFKVIQEGVYIIGIKPNVTFISLYVLLYFDDGKTVSLSLNNSYSNVTFKDTEIEVTAYIYGSTYENLSSTQIVQDLGLYLQFISPLSSENEI